MYKVVAVTDPETADGFNLTPVETHAVQDTEEARKLIKDLLNDDTVGVLIVNEDFMEQLDERTRKQIDRVYRPVVVPVPAKKTIHISDTRRDYLASLIRLAVGFDIKLGD